MERKVIRLTEGDLYNIIKESTLTFLNEYMDKNLTKVTKGFLSNTDDYDYNWAYEPEGDDKTQVVKNQWMVHFGDIQTTRSVAKNGFTTGNDINKEPSQVTYHQIKTDKKKGTNNIFNYAYLASDVIETMKEPFNGTFMYYLTQEALNGFVMFKANGYRFFHSGDCENQVIFNNVQKNTMVEVQYLHDHYCVLDKENFKHRQKPAHYEKNIGGLKVTLSNINPKSQFEGILFASRDIETVIYWVMTNYEQYRNRIGN